MYDTTVNSWSVQNPVALQDACIEYICDNFEAVCRTSPLALTEEEWPCLPSSNYTCTPPKVLRFPGGDEVYLHTELSEQLIVKLCAKKKMTDIVLALFDSNLTRLRHVRLKDASKLSKAGLRILRGHKIVELETIGLSKATVTELIGCLGEWTLQNMRTLNVANSTFVDQNKYTIVVALSKLRSLQSLNVSGTEFNRANLELVVEDLPQLESLDIGCTKVADITALRKCKDRLKSLSLYGLKLPSTSSESVVAVLSELSELRHLDVSEDREDHPFDILSPNSGKLNVTELLQLPNVMPNLVSFDISGKEDIDIRDLINFLEHHKSLEYLGLVLTETCKHDIFVDASHQYHRPGLIVAGSSNEAQVLESLRRYIGRPQYIQKSLYHLFRQTQGYTTPRIDIIRLVLDAAHHYHSVFPIQMAATACLFNLSKGNLGQKLHPKVLGEIVEADLNAMETFPQHQQLQKNVLLTICSDRILQEVNFDKYRCAKLVMNCLCAWPDNSMNRMSVAICSILAAKISTHETSELGSHSDYMKKLLSIVRGRMEETVIDITMKFTLSALWNLTDESPKTCSVFLNEGGMKLFLNVLEAFPGEQSIETKILGLLNNIAEVQHLRSHLMVDPFVNILRKLLHSTYIDVSYFAAGIVAHLASDGLSHWTAKSISQNEMVEDLWFVVSKWSTPKDEMVAYRSFKPFFPLMATHQQAAVQLWAVWAIHHVCTKSHFPVLKSASSTTSEQHKTNVSHTQRYCSMLSRQKGDVILVRLLHSEGINECVRGICRQVVETLVEQGMLPEQALVSEQDAEMD